MGFDLHFVDLLNRIGEPDGQDRMLRFESRDGPVEMALAVADAPSAAVEGDERHEQRLGEDLRRIGSGLAHAEAAFDQNIAGPPQAPAQVGMEDLGEGNVLPALDQRLHEAARIDLAADRPIGPDRRDVL